MKPQTKISNATMRPAKGPKPVRIKSASYGTPYFPMYNVWESRLAQNHTTINLHVIFAEYPSAFM